jgi:hypothetical protein
MNILNIPHLFFALLFGSSLANTQGHYAVRGSREFLLGHKEYILAAYLSEIDELQLSDVTINQKTDYNRLVASLSSIKLTEINFENAELEIQFLNSSSSNDNDDGDDDGDDETAVDPKSCSDADSTVRVTIANFAMELEFDH